MTNNNQLTQPGIGKHTKRAKPFRKVAEPNQKERKPRVSYDPYTYGWHLFGGKPGWRKDDVSNED